MMYKVTIFERYTQQNNKKERKRHFFLHIYIKIYTFAVQFWKIYTIRIIPLCKHSEWHAGVALFLYYPTRYIPSVNALQKNILTKKMRARMHLFNTHYLRICIFCLLRTSASRSTIRSHWPMTASSFGRLMSPLSP